MYIYINIWDHLFLYLESFYILILNEKIFENFFYLKFLILNP